jgi:hypothetical protein
LTAKWRGTASARRRELDALSGAADGSWNHTLNRSAFVLGQPVGADALDETKTR